MIWKLVQAQYPANNLCSTLYRPGEAPICPSQGIVPASTPGQSFVGSIHKYDNILICEPNTVGISLSSLASGAGRRNLRESSFLSLRENFWPKGRMGCYFIAWLDDTLLHVTVHEHIAIRSEYHTRLRPDFGDGIRTGIQSQKIVSPLWGNSFCDPDPGPVSEPKMGTKKSPEPGTK